LLFSWLCEELDDEDDEVELLFSSLFDPVLSLLSGDAAATQSTLIFLIGSDFGRGSSIGADVVGFAMIVLPVHFGDVSSSSDFFSVVNLCTGNFVTSSSSSESDTPSVVVRNSTIRFTIFLVVVLGVVNFVVVLVEVVVVGSVVVVVVVRRVVVGVVILMVVGVVTFLVVGVVIFLVVVG